MSNDNYESLINTLERLPVSERQEVMDRLTQYTQELNQLDLAKVVAAPTQAALRNHGINDGGLEAMLDLQDNDGKTISGRPSHQRGRRRVINCCS